ERDEVGREGDGHRADRRETDRRVVLAGRDAPPLEIRRSHERRERGEQDEHRAEERGERVDLDVAAEELAGRRRERPAEEREADVGHRRQRHSRLRSREHTVRDQHHRGGDRDDHLGKDRHDGVDECAHLNATWNPGSVARRSTCCSDGSMIAMAGCGKTPSRTVSTRSGTAQMTSIGDRSGSVRKASRTGPYITRWNIHSRYTAARITPRAATGPQKRPPSGTPLNLNVPSSTRNSPTKPLRPGRPSDASTKTPKKAV